MRSRPCDRDNSTFTERFKTLKRIVIVGGGISGLSTAVNLIDLAAQRGEEVEVRVLESGSTIGGNIRTDRIDGYTIEWGPNGYLDNVPTTPELVDRLGLNERIQKSDESAAERYLYRHGRLHLLPSGPVGFLKSAVLSPGGRLRVMLEPFAGAGPEGRDETIAGFVSRRIGREAAEVLIDAMVSGVFAGNIHELSMASSFPKMAAMEEEYGSLVKAMIGRMKERKRAKKRVENMRARGEPIEELVKPGGPAGPGGTLTSFDDGLDIWMDGFRNILGDSIILDSEVTSIRPADSVESNWLIETGSGHSFPAKSVVVTVPSPVAAPILREIDAELGATVAEIRTANLAVVALGYDEKDTEGPLNGFGFLVPRLEGIRSLGCLWDSSIFPGRAPEGKVLLRVMIGGAHDPEAVELDDDTLLEIVRKDLVTTMELTAEPELIRIYRHPLGIGQYTPGHQTRLDTIESITKRLPGLWLAGSSYYGISMNACIEKASEQAKDILS